MKKIILSIVFIVVACMVNTTQSQRRLSMDQVVSL